MRYLNQSQKLLAALGIGWFFTLSGVARADTVQAHCQVYPRGQEQLLYTGPCIFSQRQGFVSIQVNQQRYDLRPVGEQPGNYVDGEGKAAYRQAGLDDKGQIYRLNQVSIYVYWQ